MNETLQGNCLDLLKPLNNEIVDCVITSPPYWALRDYGSEPQIWDGKPDCEHAWIQQITQHTGNRNSLGSSVIAKVKEGINDTGLHKSAFCGLCNAWRGELGLEPTFNLYIDHLIQIFREIKRVLKPGGTIWVNLGDTYASNGGTEKTHKGLGFRESGLNRQPKKTTVPEKSLCGIPERFALRMTDELGLIRRNTIIWYKRSCMPSSAKDRFTVDFEYVYFFTKSPKYYFETQYEPMKGKLEDQVRRHHNKVENRARYFGDNQMHNKQTREEIIAQAELGRMKRCVWDINTTPFKEAHFATFPPKLIEPMIRAGCPPNGLVLDPFSGAGTTALVAKQLGRNYLGLEINPKYIEIARQRLADVQLVLR